jgi:hypothetical protein
MTGATPMVDQAKKTKKFIKGLLHLTQMKNYKTHTSRNRRIFRNKLIIFNLKTKLISKIIIFIKSKLLDLKIHPIETKTNIKLEKMIKNSPSMILVIKINM